MSIFTRYGHVGFLTWLTARYGLARVHDLGYRPMRMPKITPKSPTHTTSHIPFLPISVDFYQVTDLWVFQTSLTARYGLAQVHDLGYMPMRMPKITLK